MPVSSGLTTITRCTNGSRIRATSQQLPVTSNATRSLGSRLAANALSPSGVLGTRPAERTTPSSQIATTQKSRCTSRPIARPTHLINATLHLHTMMVDTRWENQREKRHRPIRARTLNPGKSQGRPKDKHGLEAHRQKRPTRLRSPKEGPYPGSPDRRPGPGRTLRDAFSCRDTRDARQRPGREVPSLARGLQGSAHASLPLSGTCTVGGALVLR